MRIIDRKWSELSPGWQAVQGLQARLETEYGRAVQAGQNIKFRRDLTEWQKKRRVFIAMSVLAPLSLVGLCLAAFYFQQVACVLAWWTMTVLVILVTLGVAGWNYIREMVSGRPEPERARVAVNLGERWWESLRPAALDRAGSNKKNPDFREQLDHSLPKSWICVDDPFPVLTTEGSSLLLAGPPGLFLFVTCSWEGKLTKGDGTWKQELKKGKVKPLNPAPDEEWARLKDVLVEGICSRLPQMAWAAEGLQGGVVFTHSKARLGRLETGANRAPCGKTGAWLKRLQESQPDERFTLETLLELLDQGLRPGGEPSLQDKDLFSAKAEAERLYEQAAGQLREHIGKLVR